MATRSGSKWTKEEHAKMLMMLRSEKSVAEIAIVLCREPKAVITRIKLLADEKYDELRNVVEVARYMGLSVGDIEHILKTKLAEQPETTESPAAAAEVEPEISSVVRDCACYERFNQQDERVMRLEARVVLLEKIIAKLLQRLDVAKK